MTSKPTVVVFADASFDAKTGAAGWGAWVKADGEESVTRGGTLRQTTANSTHAELCAIANALAVASLMGVLDGHVMIQSDCLEALGAIRKTIGAADRPAAGGAPAPARRRNLPKAFLPVIKVISDQLCGLTVSVRHVKGHQDGGGRQWVNRACDRLAKDGMRLARASKRLEGAPTP